MATILDEMGNELQEPGVLVDEETGLEIPNSPLVTPVVQGIDAGLEAVANATTPVAQSGEPRMPELDVNVPPLEQQPMPMEPTPPAAPVMVPKKVGETTTTTTSVAQTPEAAEFIAASKRQTEELAGLQKQEQDAVQKQAEIEQQKQRDLAQMTNEVEAARAAVRAQRQAEIDSEMALLETKVQQLTAKPRKEFFDTLTDGQKIATALSIGLGSFGQALTGSGQNVGLVMLRKRMDQFDKAQDDERDAKLKEIENRRLNINTKRQLMKDVDDQYTAQKLALTEAIKGEYEAQMAMAKTPQVQAQIAQKYQEMENRSLQQRAELAQSMAAKKSVTEENDIIQMVVKTPGIGPDGQPIKLTEAQGKARLALSQMAASAQAVQELADAATDPAMAQLLREQARREDYYSKLPIIGPAAMAGSDLMWGSLEERLAKTSPRAAAYYNAANAWTAAYLRFTSGAAIGIQEAAKEYKNYWPMPGDTPEMLANKAKKRAAAEKEMMTNGGL